jgi:dethiobiotin synthetase
VTVLVVTGTGTDVGKTVATAALAACATGRVAVVKPAQTGVADGAPGDLAEVTRLTGITDVHEFVRYPDPLSPHQAARLSGRPPLKLSDAVQRIVDLEATHDLVIVEGAGGLLVPFDEIDNQWTLVDLAATLRAPTLLVTHPGLGTLNHTALTVEVMWAEGVPLHGIVIGSWPDEPDEPDLAMRANLVDLAEMSPVVGVLPAGMAAMKDFRTRARAHVAPRYGGRFSWRSFVTANGI